jgi:DNA-binding NarL/FixJ family response regulator
MIIEVNEDLVVIGTAENGYDAVEKTVALQPDIVLMDIAMPEMNGIEALRIICERLPSVRVIILSMHHTSEHVYRAVQAGAWGYILKESAGSHVVKAIRSVYKGHKYFCDEVDVPSVLRVADSRSALQSPIDSLSLREREVLQLVVEGKTSVEIAKTLGLSPKSVETYRSRLMLKLGISNIPSLVKFALQHGITPT